MNPPEQLEERKSEVSPTGHNDMPDDVVRRLLDDISFDLEMLEFDPGLKALFEDGTCPMCITENLTPEPKKKDNWRWPVQLPPTM